MNRYGKEETRKPWRKREKVVGIRKWERERGRSMEMPAVTTEGLRGPQRAYEASARSQSRERGGRERKRGRGRQQRDQ